MLIYILALIAARPAATLFADVVATAAAAGTSNGRNGWPDV